MRVALVTALKPTLTARADDSHATPVLAPSLTVGSSPFQVPTTSMSNPGKVLRAASN